ncbi:hypothetical protein QBZ16_005451 [Prototheca wickerhamii]|uniref:Uncharacterized protein n=1 Tax=Prototheca wickerhamii TaxID=3111 RepID=A0AAD9IFN3_PROWI|nr:hypothetical protein QBZ16_005451 [Prototheca wickerhamii]
MITNILFIIVALLTFANLTNVQWNADAGDLGAQLNGVLAACFMAPVLTAFLDLAGFLILAKKTYALSGTGVSYGGLAASYLWAAVFMMLTGIELTASKHWTSTFESTLVWDSNATSEYTAALILAFLCVGGYFAMFGMLLGCYKSLGRGTVTMDEVEDRIRTMPMSDLGSNPSYGVRGV